MKVVQYTSDKSPDQLLVGVLQDNVVVDITHLASSTKALIAGGSNLEEEIELFLGTNPPTTPLYFVDLKAPITGMDKVICIGMNYYDHCAEQKVAVPTEPLVFNKFPSCVVGPYDDVPYPPSTQELDWEVELVVVIGKEGFQVAEENALEYVYGYTVGHDISARDWQMRRNGGQWLVGKSMPKFAPIGPAIATRSTIPDPQNLNLYCKVNGVTKQDSSTKEMVFSVKQLVSWVSKFFTILPGDLIFTGTPPGVGVFKSPPEFLKPGDTVICGIQHIGEVQNKIV